MNSEEQHIPTVPIARMEAHERTVHGDTFIDPYEWLRNKDAQDTRDFIAAENAYTQERTAKLDSLRHTLFDEFKNHVQQTDMSVPTRHDDYWYFTRTREGSQYAIQCRLPIRGADDWDPPQINVQDEPGTMPGEQIVFDANREAGDHDFFRLGGLDLSKDGRWLLYGTDTHGNERYDFRIRDLNTGQDLPDHIDGIAAGCLTPDGRWVFYTELDDAWRPYRIRRHLIGTDVADDPVVFEEHDERFWVGVGLSFDEKQLVIGTGSKTTTEVLMLPVDNPTGEFRTFIPRHEGIEYDVSFASFEGAGENGADIPLAIVFHNALDPNFEIDIIDMRRHQPPFQLGEGTRIACGSPFGCEDGDRMMPGASAKPVSTPFFCDTNPQILQGARGLVIEGIAMHRYFVSIGYRANGLVHLATMTKKEAAANFLAGEPWNFRELLPPQSEPQSSQSPEPLGELHTASAAAADTSSPAAIPADSAAHPADTAAAAATPPASTTATSSAGTVTLDPAPLLYSIGSGGNPNYDAPRMRYSFGSFTQPAELHDFDPTTGEDRLLKRATVLNYDPSLYRERRAWVTARDGERVPVSLVWREDRVEQHLDNGLPANVPAFVLGYGAYEISSDPGFSVGRLGLLDRGVLYVLAHVRGGGEMGRAWYEQGRRLAKKHTFEDFIDVTAALQNLDAIDRARTVANGGSAGGLLMGAVANMAPELFAGIEADVPFVDALTTILDPSLPLTVTEWDEWGDPLHDEQVYEYMKSYSPYENAPVPLADGEDERTDTAPSSPSNSARQTDGMSQGDSANANQDNGESGQPVYHWPDGRTTHVFPKIFVTTSVNDTRVMVVEPLKWVARLQAAGVDAIIHIETEAGHGGTSGRYRQWEQISYENAWCLHIMGIDE